MSAVVVVVVVLTVGFGCSIDCLMRFVVVVVVRGSRRPFVECWLGRCCIGMASLWTIVLCLVCCCCYCYFRLTRRSCYYLILLLSHSCFGCLMTLCTSFK